MQSYKKNCLVQHFGATLVQQFGYFNTFHYLCIDCIKLEKPINKGFESLVSEELARDSFLLFSKLYLFYLIVSITSVIIRKVLMVAGKPMWGIQLMTVATTVSGVLPALRHPKKWECSWLGACNTVSTT